MKASLFIKCRCGESHPVRERETACKFCNGPTWDHHAVCARCRGVESALAAPSADRSNVGQSSR